MLCLVSGCRRLIVIILSMYVLYWFYQSYLTHEVKLPSSLQTDRNPDRDQEETESSAEDSISTSGADISQSEEESESDVDISQSEEETVSNDDTTQSEEEIKSSSNISQSEQEIESDAEISQSEVKTESSADIHQSKEETDSGTDISQSEEETVSSDDISQSEEETESGGDISQSEEKTESSSEISQSEEETESSADISQSEEETESSADTSQSEEETESGGDTIQSEEETESNSDISQSEEETESSADISQSEEETGSSADISQSEEDTESSSDIRQSEDTESGADISQSEEETESSADISQSEEDTESSADKSQSKEETGSGEDTILKAGADKSQSEEEPQPSKSTAQNQTKDQSVIHGRASLKRILFYNPHGYYINKGATQPFSFQQCEVTNCILSFNKREYSISDAVLLQWRRTNIDSYPKEKRPQGQIWIYIQTEPPPSKNPTAERIQKYPLFYLGMKNSFNWTLTYSKLSDMYLPYGILKIKPNAATLRRDYVKIAKSKTKDALYIVSHCLTPSRREEYAEILKQYISVDILGKCGQKWDCNHRYPLANDSCFDILNSTYRYYLAFENKLCAEYISDRFFETFDYDILQVVRGADLSYRPVDIDPKAYISASDFRNVHALGRYLQGLSKNITEYANMLEHKDKYTNIPFLPLFKQSMCDVCKRLNNLEKYKFVYKDLYEWLRDKEPCFEPNDF